MTISSQGLHSVPHIGELQKVFQAAVKTTGVNSRDAE